MFYFKVLNIAQLIALFLMWKKEMKRKKPHDTSLPKISSKKKVEFENPSTKFLDL